MRLEAISVGRTRTIEMRSGAVPTAYLKTPVAGKCYVEAGGLQGNETAVHPDAVYAIAAEHYEYWALRLGVDRSAWRAGHFAENLTIAGLDESQLRIGDVIAVGSEVELIVAGPRIPCFKLSWSLGQPDTFIREFGLSGRAGVYLGVRRSGWIEAGMPVDILHREPAHPTVAEVSKLALDCPHPPEEMLRTLLALPYFSRSAALVLEAALMRAIDGRADTGTWRDWREFIVTCVVDECLDVRSFTLRPTDDGPLPRARAGQFVVVQVPGTSGQDPIIRPWSLSDWAHRPSGYRISVKRQADGVGSSRLHESVREGTRLNIRPPSGQFMLDRSVFMPVVLIGAGIGITPLLAMAKAHLARGSSAPKLRMIHCVRSGDFHPLREEIDLLAERHPKLRVRYVYSRPTDEDVARQRFHQRGHLIVDDVLAELKDLSITLGNKEVSVPWFECDFYICGPEGLEGELTRRLIERGGRQSRIFCERFQPAGDQAASQSIESAQVVFARSGQSLVWTQSENLSLLELAERSGLAPPSGCRIGVCSSCQCGLLEGDVRYEFRPIADVSGRTALLCCAKPATARVVLDL